VRHSAVMRRVARVPYRRWHATVSKLQSDNSEGASKEGVLASAATTSAVLDLAASATFGAARASSRTRPQNPASPSGLPSPVGPSYPTSALQKYFGVHFPSDPEVMS
jgi:hypothetical protein